MNKLKIRDWCKFNMLVSRTSDIDYGVEELKVDCIITNIEDNRYTVKYINPTTFKFEYRVIEEQDLTLISGN